MRESRRSFICSVVGMSAMIGLAGCQDKRSDSGDAINGGPDVGEISIPHPIVESVESPEPIVDDTGVEEHDERATDYNGEFKNDGADGTVIIDLYWAKGSVNRSEPERNALKFVDSKTMTVEGGEWRDFSFSAIKPDEYDGYFYFVSPVSVTAGVRNDGGGGKVVISLLKGDEEIDSETIQMEADETSSIELTNETGSGEEMFDVRAVPVED